MRGDPRTRSGECRRACGAVPGFAAPYGLKNVRVVVDDLGGVSPNLVAGANQVDYHMKNVNFGRDYTTPYVSDITAAAAGEACPECGSALKAERGVEVGNIFKLGTWFSQALGCNFQDENGENQLVIMGSYGIGLGRRRPPRRHRSDLAGDHCTFQCSSGAAARKK